MNLATQTYKGQADAGSCNLPCFFIVYVFVYVPSCCELKPIEIYPAAMRVAINQHKLDYTRKQFPSLWVVQKQNILTKQMYGD